MGFFGEIVTSEKVEIPIPDGYILKILMACLPNQDGASILFVQSTNDDNGFALCNLNKKSTAHCTLQHEFGPEDSPVVFWATGDDIHMTGNWIWDEDELSDDEDSCDHDGSEQDSPQDDEGEEEDEKVIVETPLPPAKDEKTAKKASTGKRTRETETTVSSKKQKQPKEKAQRPPSEPIVPSEELVVISRPPSDTSARGVWKIKPVNNEGTLIPSPKQKSQSGVLVSDYVVGNGAEPKLGSTVCITYEGLFPDGKRFDANLKRSKPLKFRKGSGQVIRGLDLGLEGMRIGGSREIVIPAVLGYGAEGYGDIPANQTLVFRVTLVGVENKRR